MSNYLDWSKMSLKDKVKFSVSHCLCDLIHCICCPKLEFARDLFYFLEIKNPFN